MKYSRASTLFFDTPLAILPSKVDELRLFWEAKLGGASLDFEDRQEPFAVRFFSHDLRFDDEAGKSAGGFLGGPFEVDAAMAAASSPTNGGGLIAVIPLHGVMAPRMNMMQAMSGGTSTTQFAAALREQVANPQVKAIIVDVDSPGGSVYGTAELADVIWSLRGTKPIIAQVEKGTACSAAYWAISQMDEIVASVSADLGHIGVATLLIDRSGEAEQAGVKVLQVTAGKYKHEQAVGTDLTPWTDDQVAHAQQRVDEAYAMFVGAVARGREVSRDAVRNGFGEGRVVSAQEAVKLGMADRIATLEQTIQRFATGGRVSRKGAAAELDVASKALIMAAEGNLAGAEDLLINGEPAEEEPRGILNFAHDRDLLALDLDRASA